MFKKKVTTLLGLALMTALATMIFITFSNFDACAG